MTEEEIEKFRERLCDWTNKDEVGTRFPKFPFWTFGPNVVCPNCKSKNLLGDEWPPNYGGGSSGGYHSESWGSQKTICMDCEHHFTVGIHTKENFDSKEVNISYSETVPLASHESKPGKLLTPNDLYCEEYNDEHGEYPRQVYG